MKMSMVLGLAMRRILKCRRNLKAHILSIAYRLKIDFENRIVLCSIQHKSG